MTEFSYRVVPKGKGGFDVEMERPDGRKRTVPGFLSEHEAEAWIVQAKRLIRDVSPLTPLAPRKPVTASPNPAPASIVPTPPPEVTAAVPPEPPRRAASARSRTKIEPEGFTAAG